MRHLRARRCSAAGLVALALSTTLTVSASAPATAANDGHWWFDAYGIQAIHDEGWTGAGVKIAVIDSNINPDLPVFAGRNLTVDPRPLCADATSVTTTATTEGAVHGTTVVAQIIGSGQGPDGIEGIAPGAEVTFYSMGTRTQDGVCTSAEYGDELTPLALGVQRAIDDGAAIIISSIAGGTASSDSDVIANAIAKGIMLVGSGPNPSTVSFTGLREYRGVVVASAVDATGRLAELDDGQPLVYSGTTVVAPGQGMATVGSEGKSWDTVATGSGSSFSAPLVAGMLALSAQRYPTATASQIVQALLRNTGDKPHDLFNDAASGYGYGLAWPSRMVSDDPTAYPDENLLLDSESGKPTAAQIEAAATRGSGFPPSTVTIDTSSETPVPRGADEAPSASTSAAGLALIIVGAVLAIVLVGGGVTAAVVVASRKRARKATSDDRSV